MTKQRRFNVRVLYTVTALVIALTVFGAVLAGCGGGGSSKSSGNQGSAPKGSTTSTNSGGGGGGWG
jgi:ABC-type glycerol-3-phosphate transport system substrate-binding protein